MRDETSKVLKTIDKNLKDSEKSEIELIDDIPKKKYTPQTEEKRSDFMENRYEIEKYFAKNPLATITKAHEDLGLSVGCVAYHRTMTKREGSKSQAINDMLDKDMYIVQTGLEAIIERISDPELLKRIDSRTLSYMVDVSAKRYSIFKGELTDPEGGLKKLDQGQEDAIALLQSLMNGADQS